MKMGYESSWCVLEVKLSDTIDLESNLNVQPLAKKTVIKAQNKPPIDAHQNTL